MQLTEQERSTIKDLQTQEKSCAEKYTRYIDEANDPVLKSLFKELAEKEQKHYNSLEQVLQGHVPDCNCNDSDGRSYSPTATYDSLNQTPEMKSDCFLATDCISSEKLISSEYNSDVFAFQDSDIRKLLADIQVEEQNHAEMLYKYKMVNGMAS